MTYNPVSEQLKSHATHALFSKEKQNYLTAAKEIDRLHALILRLHACVSDHTQESHHMRDHIMMILQESAS